MTVVVVVVVPLPVAQGVVVMEVVTVVVKVVVVVTVVVVVVAAVALDLVVVEGVEVVGAVVASFSLFVAFFVIEAIVGPGVIRVYGESSSFCNPRSCHPERRAEMQPHHQRRK